jgi:hypothetical protein
MISGEVNSASRDERRGLLSMRKLRHDAPRAEG